MKVLRRDWVLVNINGDFIETLWSRPGTFYISYNIFKKIPFIEYENGDDLGMILNELSHIAHVNMMVALANQILNNVYEGFPPPRSEIDVRNFFESLFGATDH